MFLFVFLFVGYLAVFAKDQATLSSGAYFAAAPASAEAALRIFPGFEILHFDLSFRFRWFLLR